MTEKDTGRLYEPPRARDLSGSSVSGQEPLGTCVGGDVPYTGCSAGTSVFPGDCSPGTEVGVYPQCRAGGYAHSACLTGGQAG